LAPVFGADLAGRPYAVDRRAAAHDRGRPSLRLQRPHSPRAVGFDAGRPAAMPGFPQGVDDAGRALPERDRQAAPRSHPGAGAASWTCSPRGLAAATLPPTRTTGCAPALSRKGRGRGERPLWILLGGVVLVLPHRLCERGGLQLARRPPPSAIWRPRRARRLSRAARAPESSSRARPSRWRGARWGSSPRGGRERRWSR